jgi:hypothetical protein
MSECRSCGAEVVFVPSAKSGKPMILDAKPETRIVLRARGTGEDGPIAYSLAEATFLVENGGIAAVARVFTDHHVTCPKAKDWQGRTRANAPLSDPDGVSRSD